MVGAIIGLLSAVIVASITQAGQYLRDRKNHADTKDDMRTSEIDEIKSLIEELRRQIQEIRDENAEARAVDSRTKILRFCEEMIRGTVHTKEHFDAILKECDNYERYCESHPNFENNITVHTISYIEEMYDKLLIEHKFKNDLKE